LIERVQELVAEEPTREVWKRLRYFLDPASASDLIRRRQGLSPGQFEADVKKQAHQLGFSILQAEEYFTASERVSLPTRPVLLYYGAVSLSKALILVAKDGTHSYDALRRGNRHQHHGLVLSRRILSKPTATSTLEGFLESVSCRVHTNPSGLPWGHFPLFYQALSTPVFQYKKEVHDDFRGSSLLWSLEVIDGPPGISLDELCERSLALLDLVRALPDLYFALRDLNLTPSVARGSLRMREERIHTGNPDGTKNLSRILQIWDFFVDGIDPPDKASLLGFLAEINTDLRIITDYGPNIHMRMSLERLPQDDFPRRYFPDVIQDAHSRSYYVLEPKKYLDEPASYLAILFSLGMVARYYPDVWMKSIQQNVRLAEFLDTVLNLVYRRFPNLILDQMTLVKHYVHT